MHELTSNESVVESQYLLKLQSGKIAKKITAMPSSAVMVSVTRRVLKSPKCDMRLAAGLAAGGALALSQTR